MQSLTLHPDCLPCPITSVEAEIAATASGCRARFVMRGDVSAIKVPAGATAVREDLLWQATCCEIFWQPRGGSAYREFNLSPSSKWAAYDFSDFREGMANAPVDAVSISASRTADALELAADIAADLPTPADVALNVIIEDLQGNLYNWALAFPPGGYEFHSEVCRQIHIEANST